MVARGATTIWERWNGDTGDVAMNSFNHYALGAITQFLYRRVAGIDTVGPGFQHLRVRPLLDARLGDGQAHYDGVHGRISTAWGHRPDGQRWFTLTVPAGGRACVALPGRLPADVGAGIHRFEVAAA
jgi:alpha-L-rhamnosidase